MSVTLINGEHHRNPSGCHNKVNWILSVCKWDEQRIIHSFSNFSCRKDFVYVKNNKSYHSWFDALWIAQWWVQVDRVYEVPDNLLVKYHWLRAEYKRRKEWMLLEKKQENI